MLPAFMCVIVTTTHGSGVSGRGLITGYCYTRTYTQAFRLRACAQRVCPRSDCGSILSPSSIAWIDSHASFGPQLSICDGRGRTALKCKRLLGPLLVTEVVSFSVLFVLCVC